jgi:hypothetical protein
MVGVYSRVKVDKMGLIVSKASNAQKVNAAPANTQKKVNTEPPQPALALAAPQMKGGKRLSNKTKKAKKSKKSNQ